MEISGMYNSDNRFIVWAESTSHDKPLIMTDLPPARLFDDIVVPYQTDRVFFVDGEPWATSPRPQRLPFPDLGIPLFVASWTA